MAARLINANVGLRFIDVGLDGFDTHDDQPARIPACWPSSTRRSRPSSHTARPSYRNRVTIMTMSEFGRTPYSNESGGTDHGTANGSSSSGRNVKGGLYGMQPSLAGAGAVGPARAPRRLPLGASAPCWTDGWAAAAAPSSTAASRTSASSTAARAAPVAQRSRDRRCRRCSRADSSAWRRCACSTPATAPAAAAGRCRRARRGRSRWPARRHPRRCRRGRGQPDRGRRDGADVRHRVAERRGTARSRRTSTRCPAPPCPTWWSARWAWAGRSTSSTTLAASI